MRTSIKKFDGAKAPYAGRERASSTSAPPFTKLLKLFSQEALLWGAFCVARRYTMPVPRPDRNGSHQQQFRINKKKIYATQTVCGICGKPVDFSLKYPHPLSACIDHIIPIAKGGHPSALENLQLAHWCCNRQKSDKLVEKQVFDQKVEAVSNRVLPQTFDWKSI